MPKFRKKPVEIEARQWEGGAKAAGPVPSQSASRVVLKYALDPTTGGQHAIPRGSKFLSLQMQGVQPVMWWSVPKEPDEFPNAWPLRTFTVVPTGGPGYTSDVFTYVGTFQLERFVGHVFCWEPDGL